MLTFSFLIVAWVVLLTIFLWDLIQHGMDKIYMFIIIPLTLFLTVTTYITVQSMLGYPTDKVKEGKFTVISSAVKEPDWIFYWVAYHGDEEPIAYRFPYSEEDHDKQEELSGRQADGEIIQGELVDEDAMNQTQSKSVLGEIEFYTFDVSQLIPKSEPIPDKPKHMVLPNH